MAAGQDKVYHERQSGPAVLLTQGVRFTSLVEHVRAAPGWSNRWRSGGAAGSVRQRRQGLVKWGRVMPKMTFLFSFWQQISPCCHFSVYIRRIRLLEINRWKPRSQEASVHTDAHWETSIHWKVMKYYSWHHSQEHCDKHQVALQASVVTL